MEHKLNKQNFFEAFVNLMISSLFTNLYLLCISLFSVNSEKDFMGNTFYFCIIIFFISGLVFQVLLDLFSETKKRVGLHIRILFFWLLIVISICALIKQIYAPTYLIPGMIIEYIFTAILNKPILYQEKFLKQIEPLTQNSLGSQLRDNSTIVETLNKAIDVNKTYLTVTCFVLILGTIIVSKLVHIKDSPIILILMIIFELLYFLSVFFLFSAYDVFKKNTYFAFLGFKDTITKKYRIIRSACVILIISTIFAGTLSSNNSLINISNLFTQNNKQISQQQKTLENQSQINPFEMEPKIDLEDVLGNQKENPVLDLIADILEYVFIAAFILFVIYLFYKFILTNLFFEFFKEHTLLKILKSIWQTIIDFFDNLFKLDKENEEYVTVNSKDFKKQMDNYIIRSKKSTEKKKELDRLTKQFTKIIVWGDKRNIIYKNTMAPKEYLMSFTTTFTEKKVEITSELEKAIKNSAYFFEKALYSDELLTEQEEKQFISSVKIITGINL